MRSVLLAMLLVCIANTSLACSPFPDEVYDQLTSNDIAIGVAEVTSVTITPSGEAGSCMSTSYSTIEIIMGEFPNTVSVKNCNENISSEKAKSLHGNDDFGFVSGATVLVGMVQLTPNEVNFRYAVLSCWGPFHLRLDTLSNEERSETMKMFREAIARH